MEVRSDRRFLFDAPAEDVWQAIGDVDRYRTWWPWLRELDGSGFEAGSSWRCVVRPPVPYSLEFCLRLDRVTAPTSVEGTVTGDITGEARLDVASAPGGCEVRLASRLAPASPSLRTVGAIAPWLARFGHDWVLDTGLRQFRRRAL